MSPSLLPEHTPVLVSETARKIYGGFEKNYLKLRAAEHKLLTKEQLLRLPFPEKSDPDYAHWGVRRKNINRVVHHLNKTRGALNILDVGCGNGFFTHLLSKQGHFTTGVDINLTELQQAAEAFGTSHTRWCCIDVESDEIPNAPFDAITFGASFHYFARPNLLLQRCKTLLRPGGEIHIFDSPFYTPQEVLAARSRSAAHFSRYGVEDLLQHYFHNTYAVLAGSRWRFAYKPGGLFHKIFRRNDSPFPWIIIAA